MTFDKLIVEAERSGYMLGSHSARESEKVRGFPTKSTIADIGFINRDPEEDIKLPNTPVPTGVKATYAVIVDAFKRLIQNEEHKQTFLNAAVPFVENYNTVKAKINQLQPLIQRLASLQTTLKTTNNPDKITSLIDKVKEEIDVIRGELEAAVENQNSNEQNTLNSLIDTLLKSTEDKDKLTSALDRYFSLVEQRKNLAQDSIGLNYLLISPVISLVKFYNNTLNQRKTTDVTKYKSSSSILGDLESIPQSAPLAELIQLAKLVAPKLRDDANYKGSIEQKAAKILMTEKIKMLKPYLPQLVYNSLLVFTNRFFNKDEGAEGRLMAILLDTAPRALLKATKE